MGARLQKQFDRGRKRHEKRSTTQEEGESGSGKGGKDGGGLVSSPTVVVEGG